MGDVLHARTLRDAMSRFLEALTAQRDEIDLFPVQIQDSGQADHRYVIGLE